MRYDFKTSKITTNKNVEKVSSEQLFHIIGIVKSGNSGKQLVLYTIQPILEQLILLVQFIMISDEQTEYLLSGNFFCTSAPDMRFYNVLYFKTVLNQF